MFKSQLKVILRNLYREKRYVLINLSGLSLGIACCIILGLFLRSELTYDMHNVNYKRIFRVVDEVTTNEKTDAVALTSPFLAPLLSKEYPEIEAYVRFRYAGNSRTLLRHGDQAFYWENVMMADKNVFEVFDHEYIYGDPKEALNEPSSIAVSESFAKKYFGDTNPIGKTLNTDTAQYKITLVFADLPENSHLRYDALTYYGGTAPDNESLIRAMLWNVSDYTYLVMSEDYDPESFKDIIEPFYEDKMKDIGETLNSSFRFWLEPLAQIHLRSNLQYDQPTGNIFHIYGFTAIAIFILLIACINYMNLATARSLRRAREIGMRKVLGASRPQLICQFMGESIVFSIIALLIGLVMVKAAIVFTPVNELLGKAQLMNLTQDPILLVWMLGLSLVTGIISGIYPAFYLSSILPISALTTTGGSGKKGFRLRQFLVLVQFIISIGVVACTVLMANQMNYITDKPLGFNKENQVIIRLRGADLIEKVPTIKNELSKNSNILSMATTNSVPGQPMPINLIQIENNEGAMTSQTVNRMPVGKDFMKVLEIPLVSGRDFSKRLLTDVGLSVVVNEALVKKMGWDEPLGKRVGAAGGGLSGRVIGVIKDFHFQSLHHQVEPLVIHTTQDTFTNMAAAARAAQTRTLLVHISDNDVSNTLNLLSDLFAKFDPKHPFEYEFLDDTLDQLYFSEQQIMKLTGIFSGICIFISCLGLFGLSAFTTERRTKEIGIRKVLGASTSQIILMLTTSVIWLVLIASAVASLTAYLAIDEWLSGFAYRAGINPLVFVMASLIGIIVAFATIALQSFKTAQANPVKALRYE